MTVSAIEIDPTGATVNYVLKYNGTKFVPASMSFTDISGVIITSATPEQFLKWDGSNWVNADIPQINALDDIGNVDVSTATSGQFLKYNGSNWINDSIPTINNLDDIGDVNAATPSTNQVLLYDGENWIASSVSSASGSSYAETIGDGATETFTITHNLGTKDVFVSLRESGDDYENLNVAWRAVDDSSIEVSFDSAPASSSIRVLVYSSIASANGTTYTTEIGNGADTEITVTHNLGTRNIIPICRLAAAPYSDVQVSWEALTDDTVKFYFGSAPDSNSIKVIIFSSVSGSEVGQSIESLTNTYISSATPGQFLKWNGSQWVNDSIPTINALDDIGDVVITSATPGHLIKWDGFNWVNSDTVGDLTITGDLTVSGTTTTINTENLLIEDNIITLNSNVTSSPTQNAGIEVERGTSDNVQIRWNESIDKWQFTNDGTIYKDLGSGGVTVSDTIPSSPAQGDMWYESDTGALYAYYDSFWIEIGGSAAYDQIVGSIQAKGDLLVGEASQSIARLPAGTNNKKLSANSSTSTGLEWVDDNQNTVVDAVGDILIGATPNLMTRLPLGSNGQVLTVDSNQTYGLGWVSQNTRNILYNGAMQVHQRGTSTASITTSGYYTADRWRLDLSNFGTWTQTIENDAPTGSGFRKSLKILCTTADSSPSTADFGLLVQNLEGQDLQLIKKGTSSAEQITLSFWVKSNVTGTYIAALYDNDNNRSISKSYTINSSATWEYKTITFNSDTTGQFDNDENLSMSVYFALGAGSSRTSGSLNTTWNTFAASDFLPGQVNVSASTNNYFQITGVQFNVGPVASPFEFKSYQRELQECQRYYYRVSPNQTGYPVYGIAQCTTTTNADVFVNFAVPMRARPTTIEQSGTASHYAVTNAGASVLGCSSVPVFRSATTAGCNIGFIVSSGLVAGNASQGLSNNTASSYLAFSAEL